VSCAKTAKVTGMPFELRIQVGPRNHLLDGGSDFLMGRGKFEGKRWPIIKYSDCLLCKNS